MPTLTVLYHPMLSRIGERALLSELMVGRAAKISRLTPRFAPTSARIGTALDEQHISRRPFLLRRVGDGSIEFDANGTRTCVAVDGMPVLSGARFRPTELEAGVILELGTQVALLLHMHLPSTAPEDGNLGLIGDSTVMRSVRDDIRKVAEVDIPVLIRGETGSGKELVANAIHRVGPRREQPMVCVNLAALPASLAASELFGVMRGAFTGAARSQDGYFRRADQSTLFLDELGEVPVDVQAMLLRALETGEIFSLGAQVPQKVDVRLIAATDADLEDMMASGEFRAPLLHRLAGYEIHMPPLRERPDDIGPLLMHFLAEDLAEAGELHLLRANRRVPWLPMSLMLRLLRYEWPGNVRQLRNAARQLVISNRGCLVAELPGWLARHLAFDESRDSAYATWGPNGERTRPVNGARNPMPIYRRPSEIPEIDLIESLRNHRWDIKATAAALQISRTSLYALIRASDRIQTAGELSAQEIERCHRAVGGDLDAMVERLCVSRNALRRRVKELGLA